MAEHLNGVISPVNYLNGVISPVNYLNGSISSEANLSATINGVIRTFIENNYESLQNLPSINGVVVKGNLELEDLGISQVIFKDNIYQFPNVGNSKYIYVSTDENKVFRWDNETLKYYVIGSSYSDIKIIDGGNASV